MSKTQPKPQADQTGEWFPIEELEPSVDMKIMVRASKKGKPVLVRFRKTRAYNPEAMRFMPFLKMYDAENNCKLSFKPIEFQPVKELADADG